MWVTFLNFTESNSCCCRDEFQASIVKIDIFKAIDGFNSFSN